MEDEIVASSSTIQDPLLPSSLPPSAGFYHDPTCSAFRVPQSKKHLPEVFQCITCGRKFAAYSLLTFHSALCWREKRMTALKKSVNEAQKRKIKIPNRKAYFCMGCGLFNPNAIAFARHCRVVHSTDSPEFQEDGSKFTEKLKPWVASNLGLSSENIILLAKNLNELYLHNAKFDIKKLEKEHADILRGSDLSNLKKTNYPITNDSNRISNLL